MLQQTRSEAVVPYYRRFLAVFPSVEALARASLDEVLRLWEGLGYYGRARNLLAAARQVMAERGGQLPTRAVELARLPGVGAYTAAAVASIAFGERVVPVDGNVYRVAARLFLLAPEGDGRRPRVRRAAAARLRRLLGDAPPGEFAQALMELGATVCRPGRPRCGSCPVAGWCRARAAGQERAVPGPAARRELPEVELAVGLVWAGGRLLLVRRGPGLLGGLWGFPGAERRAGEAWEEALRRHLRESLGLEAAVGPEAGRLEHVFSHLRWRVRAFHCFPAGVGEGVRAGGGVETRWVAPGALGELALPRPFRRLAEQVECTDPEEMARRART